MDNSLKQALNPTVEEVAHKSKTKLSFAIAAIAIVCLAIGYLLGCDTHIHPKGDGSAFYIEETPYINWMLHSTLECPRIQYGISQKISHPRYLKVKPYRYCAYCMTDNLMSRCYHQLHPQHHPEE